MITLRPDIPALPNLTTDESVAARRPRRYSASHAEPVAPAMSDLNSPTDLPVREKIA